MSFFTLSSDERLLFTPVSITPLIDTEDACFDLNVSRPIAKGDLKWRDALLVSHRVNSNDERTVSYTHLDVYKRQSKRRAKRYAGKN